MPDTYFYQDGHTTTQFDGELIAHVSSASPSKQRWTEFDLFITLDEEWILQGIGRTTVPAEKDRYWAIVSKDPNEVLEALWVKSRAARKLLSSAMTYLAECVCEDENNE